MGVTLETNRGALGANVQFGPDSTIPPGPGRDAVGEAAADLTPAYWGGTQGVRLVVWGDSLATQQAASSNAFLGGAFVPLGLYNARNPIDMVAVGGNSGNRTDQIAANFASQVLANTPDFVLIPAGTNDLTQGYSSDATLNGYATLCALVESIGAVPICMTIPAGETFSGGTSALRSEWVSFNEKLRNLARVKRWPLLDAMYAYIDPSSSTSAPLPGHTDGAVHPYNKGAQAIGVMLGTLLSKLPRRSLFNPRVVAENACTNPLMTGSGGTLPGGVTGSAPTGVQMTLTGTGVSSIVQRTDGGAGNWWEVSFASSSAGSGPDFIIPSASLATAGISVGDVVRMVADVHLLAGHSGILTVNTALRFNGTSTWARAYSAQSSNGSLRDGEHKMQQRVPEIAAPVGTTSLGLYVSVTAATGAMPSGTIRIGGVSAGKVA